MIAKIGFFVWTVIMLLAIDRTFFREVKLPQATKHSRNYWIGTLLWAGILSILSLSGFLQDFTTIPPRMMVVIFPPLIALILLLLFWKADPYLAVIPWNKLIYLQCFRIAVEFSLWLLYNENLIPVQMTFEGLNFDIISGILAIIVSVLMTKYPSKARMMGIVYNIIGLTLLINIVSIAILSIPSPFRMFHNEPANVAVTWFPIVFLPGILVPMAYYLHVLSLRQLLRKRL